MTRDDRTNRHRGRRVWAVALLVGVVAALTVPAGAGSSEPRFITTWGTEGSGDGQFANPRGVAVAPDGTVYVADTDNHRIQHFDPTGTFVGAWGTEGTGDGQFDQPNGVAVAPDGTVYVADRVNNRIQHFDPTGTFQGAWGELGSGDGQFNLPETVAVAPDGIVYVADTFNHRIQYFTPTGDFLDEWGELGSGDSQFDLPGGVAVSPDGTVYVVDVENDRIQYFGPTGDFQGEWGETGSASEQFNVPAGVAVSADGTVYVVDLLNSRIQYFDPTGTYQGEWGDFGSADGQFISPVGVATAPFGVVYVADTSNHRIQKFDFTEPEPEPEPVPDPDPSVLRLSGANRYETAAAVAAHHHPDGASTVFVATGANFPDALAGAVAAAASGSPLLLAASLPEATETELDRLDPSDIVILGGPAAVSAATEETLSGFGATERLAGANRYDTAIAISQHVFGAGEADAVVVATGENFPDALAAAPLAAVLGGPVLLTPTATLHQSVIDEITRLDPAHIYVVGGPAAVSAGVFDALMGMAPTTRISGSDRYATAVEISETAFPDGAGVVYMAVGTNFPDALAGAAQAAAWGAPVLLTPTDALPQSVVDEITRLDPYTIIILGGTAVVSPAVEAHLEALLGI